MCLLAIQLSFSEKCLFSSSLHFYRIFLLIVVITLYILDINTLCDMLECIFFPTQMGVFQFWSAFEYFYQLATTSMSFYYSPCGLHRLSLSCWPLKVFYCTIFNQTQVLWAFEKYFQHQLQYEVIITIKLISEVVHFGAIMFTSRKILARKLLFVSMDRLLGTCPNFPAKRV